MFSIPPVPEPLPAELQQLVNESCKRFEERLEQMPGMATIARLNGWLTDYEDEVSELARQAAGFERTRCLEIVKEARPWLQGRLNQGRAEACDEIQIKISAPPGSQQGAK